MGGLPSYSEQGDAANGPETQAIMSVNSDFFETLDAAGNRYWFNYSVGLAGWERLTF